MTHVFKFTCAGKEIPDPMAQEGETVQVKTWTPRCEQRTAYRKCTITRTCGKVLELSGSKQAAVKEARKLGWLVGKEVERCPDCRPTKRGWSLWSEPVDVNYGGGDLETLYTKGRQVLLGFEKMQVGGIGHLIAEIAPGGFPVVKPGDHTTAKYYTWKIQSVIDAGNSWYTRGHGNAISYHREQRAHLGALRDKWWRRAYGWDAAFEVRGTKKGRPTLAEREKIKAIKQEIKERTVMLWDRRGGSSQ